MFQTAAVNKEDYPFGQVPKSYHIGAEQNDCVAPAKAISLAKVKEQSAMVAELSSILKQTHLLQFVA